ncbi:MAG TPA: hypothetical protein VG758_29400 [Hyphomicrobiaceae bacterium]|jgi:hypothetical protein|nr:hypothetical protein [Hyphomicrobiaceae bacterium]
MVDRVGQVNIDHPHNAMTGDREIKQSLRRIERSLIATSGTSSSPIRHAMDRATIRQKKTGWPVRFELTDQARMTIDEYLKLTGRKSVSFCSLVAATAHEV